MVALNQDKTKTLIDIGLGIPLKQKPSSHFLFCLRLSMKIIVFIQVFIFENLLFLENKKDNSGFFYVHLMVEGVHLQ